MACMAFAVGSQQWNIWGGILWIFSTFMDRADGELARVSGKSSPQGHRYDYVTDVMITVLFFVGIGIGLRASSLGYWSVIIGIIAATGVLMAEVLAEMIDQVKKESGEKAYPGFAGFDFDDILYLFPLIVWFDWHFTFLLGAFVGAPVFALLTWYRLKSISMPTQEAGN